jgi:hypothetical protein
VLWGVYTKKSDMTDVYFVSEAFQSKAECDGPASRKNEREAKVTPGQYALGAASTTFFQCLPDTVDPRGPKGK